MQCVPRSVSRSHGVTVHNRMAVSQRAPVHLACWSVCLGGVPARCFPVLRAILSLRGMVQAYVASQSVLRSGAVLDTRTSSCLLWPLRMELGEASTAYLGGRGGDRAPCSAGTAAQRLVADAESLNAPAGNTGPCTWARRGRPATGLLGGPEKGRCQWSRPRDGRAGCC
jgi:hypothetical protein